jgi:hypothetical protein
MTPIKLDNGFSFAIEPCEKRARSIVYKGGVENVCRRESLENLERFILSDDGKIFRGRLQLHKNGGKIVIGVKGEIAGKMTINDFASYMEKVKNISKKLIDQK